MDSGSLTFAIPDSLLDQSSSDEETSRKNSSQIVENTYKCILVVKFVV